MKDYLWDPSAAPPDPFVVELERRLGPLGEEVDGIVDDVIDAFESDAAPAEQPSSSPNSDGHAAIVLSLPLSRPWVDVGKREHERSWPWLAAAGVLLALSVVSLAREQPLRGPAPPPITEVGGDGEVMGRVELGVVEIKGDETLTPHAVLVELRETHTDLARCALELEPGAGIGVRVGLGRDGGTTRVDFDLDEQTTGDRRLSSCVRACFETWDGSALDRATVELDIHLQNNRTRGEN